jgi:hypothetical protein
MARAAGRTSIASGRYLARTSDPQLVETAQAFGPVRYSLYAGAFHFEAFAASEPKRTLAASIASTKKSRSDSDVAHGRPLPPAQSC